MINSVISYILGLIKIYLYKLTYFKRISFGLNIKKNKTTNFYIKKKSKVLIGKSYRSRNNVSIYCCDEGTIRIGNNVFMNDNCTISCRKSVTIGDNCILGNNVSIYDNDHDYKNDMNKYKCDSIKIGKNVWIGCNAVILRGTKIGDNCVIAAGSIVSGKIEAESLIYNKKELIIKEIKKK